MRLWSVGIVMACLILQTGCAQMMAACKPPPMDRSALVQGADRKDVVAALGEGRGRLKRGAVTRTESYRYADGGAKNGTGSKAGRILLYTAGDFFSLFLTQILFMPMEQLLGATHYKTTVTYQLYTDGSWRVKDYLEAPRPIDKTNGGFCE